MGKDLKEEIDGMAQEDDSGLRSKFKLTRENIYRRMSKDFRVVDKHRSPKGEWKKQKEVVQLSNTLTVSATTILGIKAAEVIEHDFSADLMDLASRIYAEKKRGKRS